MNHHVCPLGGRLIGWFVTLNASIGAHVTFQIFVSLKLKTLCVFKQAGRRAEDCLTEAGVRKGTARLSQVPDAPR